MAIVLGVLAAAGGTALAVVPSLVFPPNPAASPGLRDAVRDLSGALPVFPGAEGFGTDTPTGRGGAVLRVTSLESAGPGTLRAALVNARAGETVHMKHLLRRHTISRRVAFVGRSHS